jgi:NADPH:quinone reductase
MQAIRHHSFGHAEVLQLDGVPDPSPERGEVLIDVAAAGVHLLDTTIRAGGDGPLPLPALPTIPGREVAGTIAAIGDGVDRAWLGRRVVAHLGTRSSGYAERAIAPVEALHELTDGMDPAAAVAMIGTGRTAVAVLESARLAVHDAVLVLGAAGGLGSLLVQAARQVTDTVIGVVGGPAKADRVRALGVTAIDHHEEDWAEEVADTLGERELTVAIDGVGGTTGRTALELLSPGGRHLVTGWASGAPTRIDVADLVARGVTVVPAVGARLLRRPGGLRPLESAALERLAEGSWDPLITTYRLADAVDAHRAVESAASVGKVVLVP